MQFVEGEVTVWIDAIVANQPARLKPDLELTLTALHSQHAQQHRGGERDRRKS